MNVGERSLLAVFAHPDDESFGTGGTLARYAAEGVRVDLICATRGEAGQISDSALAAPERLGEVRENELRCACRVMGINEPHFLGYRDSGMQGAPENDDPHSLYRADRHEAVGRVSRLIRQLRPQVVVTFEPNGGYGHPDHIAIHQITVAAVAAAGDSALYPEHLAEGLAPHSVQKLYYTALPRRFFRGLAEKFAVVGIDVDAIAGPRMGKISEWGMADELVTTVIDVSAVLETKIKAFQCHATQLDPRGPFAMAMRLGGDVWRGAMRSEYFIRAQPPVQPGEPEETDIYAGVS